ncbi:MAG: HAD hydrolase family protein [Candidatus Cloacimonetes bacterium]|nr:HAD hydrolase family protein [Candidatus Cloacimonadota bacterium]
MKDYIVALDLHGTLLDEQWKISATQTRELIHLMKSLEGYASFYVCTGNDYDFVEKHLPADILALIDGLVLESGCILYEKRVKTYQVEDKALASAKDLHSFFTGQSYPFVRYFGKREATVSLFTSDDKRQKPPADYVEVIKKDFSKTAYADDFYVTWSNVAIDIIPKDISKWSLINKIKNSACVIAFMDSYNDKEICEFSDFAILPKNTTDSLIHHLRWNNKLVFPLHKFHIFSNQCYISQKPFADAVIEGLLALKESLFNR